MLTREQLLAGFRGAIQPVRPPLIYRLGLLLVCFMMILLPLVYFGIIAGVGWLVVWHATNNTGVISGGRRAGLGTLLVYLTPILAGGALVLFLIKPLFAPREKAPVPVSLTPAAEPLVFELVRRLCELVGAPMPTRIDVDTQVNASASFRRGFFSFAGHDLLLTIGLPLVAGLSLRNFAGVLGHEFGHFAQGSGMRATYLIRRINAWFARLVYERDAWDANLEAWSKDVDIRFGIVFYAIRLFIWLTRRVLWALMMAGHAVSTFMLRQMEFDADQYEVQVAGTRSFVDAAHAIPVLTLAHQASLESLRESWQERRLGDNLPRLVLARHASIPAKVRQEFLEEHLKGKGSLLDTHPPDFRRVERARATPVPGVFTLDVPASEVFKDFDGLSRRVTAAFYREVLGKEFSEKNLVRAEAMVGEESAARADQEALGRCFQDAVLPSALVFVPELPEGPPADVPAALAELQALAAEVRARLAELKPAATSLRQAEERLQELDRLTLVTRAGLQFKAADFQLAGSGAEHVSAARRPVASSRESLRQHLAPAHEALGRRLALALRLARAPELAPKLASLKVEPGEIDRLLGVLRTLEGAFSDVRKLLDDFVSAGLLLGSIQGNEEHEGLIGQLRAAQVRWEKQLGALWPRLAAQAYPFPHAQGEVRLSSFLIGKLPVADDFGATIQAVEGLGERYYGLYGRLLGRLARVAEAVEA